MRHREPLTSPGAGRDGVAERTEHQEHRLVQQHRDQAGTGQRQQCGQHPAAGRTLVRVAAEVSAGRAPRSPAHEARAPRRCPAVATMLALSTP
jgi:hypothetical protein